MYRKGLQQAWPYFVLIATGWLLYWPLGLFNYVAKWDNVDYFFPSRYFISQCIQHGITPSWNPYQYLGIPVAADPQSGFWYPITWLISLLHGYDAYGSNIDYLLHFVLAGLGMYVLLRGRSITTITALLFAIAYQGCGFFVSNAQHLCWVISAAWLPWVLHYFIAIWEQPKLKHILGLALCLALTLTGGYPAFFIILIYLLLWLGLVRTVMLAYQIRWNALIKAIGCLVISALIMAALVSGYGWSLWEANGLYNRSAGANLHSNLMAPFSPQNLVTFSIPFSAVKGEAFFNTNISMSNVYIGLIPLLFSLLGIYYARQWWARALLAFAIVSLLAAMGGYTPLREWLFYHVPLMNLFRFPAIFRLFTLLGLLVVGAIGLDAWLNAPSKKAFAMAWAILAITVGALLVWALNSGGQMVFPPAFGLPSMFDWIAKSRLFDRIVSQAALQLILLLLIALGIWLLKRPKVLLPFLLLFTIADMFFSILLNTAGTIASQDSFSVTQKALLQLPQGFPIGKKTINQSIYNLQRVPPGYYNLGLWNKVVTGGGYNPFKLNTFEQFDTTSIKDKAFSHPMIYLDDSLGNINIKSFAPNDIVADVNSPQPNTIIFQQTTYPGWHCSIDGNPSRIVLANISEMSTPVTQGRHQVRFWFYQPYLVPMLSISFVGMLIILLTLLGLAIYSKN